jgi:quinol monooxygenase YgiN
MPALPWSSREPIEPDRIYVVMSSKLPLKRSRSILGFLRDTRAIRRQLASADGLVGYSLYADLVHRTFWTFSVWGDQQHLDNFAASEPHRQIIARLRPLMDPTRKDTNMTGSPEPPPLDKWEIRHGDDIGWLPWGSGGKRPSQHHHGMRSSSTSWKAASETRVDR